MEKGSRVQFPPPKTVLGFVEAFGFRVEGLGFRVEG
jgi:hypothetical protein